MPKTLYDKIYEAHVVSEGENEPTILYIDTHLIHEVTSPQAFTGLEKRKLKVRRPDLTFATIDHSAPSINRDQFPWDDEQAQKQVFVLASNCKKNGICLYDLQSEHQGIVHVIGPEIGLTRPGKTIVCGDSHTATHGAFGALAFGIGTSEVEHVLATQCLLQNKTKNMAITIDGELQNGVYAKDIILHIINKIRINGATGYTIEYRGSTIRSLSMEARMTICNMSIEAGARAGLIAPDQTTIDYLVPRVNFKNPVEQAQTIKNWLNLQGDKDAMFDKEIIINASSIEPMVTWGTNPAMSIGVTKKIPEPKNSEEEKALCYMGFRTDEKIIGKSVDYVFIGSCTNGRIEDLRVAADIMRGKKVAPDVIVYIVPGSCEVRDMAVREGLRDIFINSGCEWREPGCSMCIAMNGDIVPSEKYCASTANRNFVGRQGKGARTLLMSPAMAAASAITGCITDNRDIFNEINI
ncbi:3-isopropylmalate dehydratase large subunit [Patescibacteria group bacterium]|nr:3-isopropylmalate dehydratase large subunit [Patescibacteria group bacterium]